MGNILYSTGCPRCEVLKKKLDAKNIPYEIHNNEQEMLSLGIEMVPVFQLDSGEKLDFGQAVKWINGVENK